MIIGFRRFAIPITLTLPIIGPVSGSLAPPLEPKPGSGSVIIPGNNISTSEIKLLLPFIGENTALSAASPSPLPAPPTRPETRPVTDPKIPDCGMPGINCAIATGELATIHTITSFDKKVSCLFLRVFILATLTQNVNRRPYPKY